MENIEKQIAGLKQHLKEVKKRNSELEKLFFSVYYLSEGLKVQNIHIQGLVESKCIGKEKAEGKLHQNEYLIKELEKILDDYNKIK